ncbi:hypothetical protein CHY_1636 [Carboxydothermus hydrogenoformans Z-2901]|uniref:Uncharacterized protein n=1 Tax=Carboxydothermus hydrogenoformans (strain ATCC BAA-161 / DSM 6008 / Z-2901) TaxID=246194 RepID=Q3ABM6_CARHZ|nr:hypothetical protein CHY_1636 [Carboxydothermus hydrogenoformans Z-2901]
MEIITSKKTGSKNVVRCIIIFKKEIIAGERWKRV